MTVAIPEAATVAAADTGGAAASSRAPARMSRPTPAQMGRAGPPGPRGSTGPRGPKTVTAYQVPRQQPAGRERPARAQERPVKEKSRKRDRPSELNLRLQGGRGSGQLHNYQAIVAAEFVAASLLVALTPIASRKATASASSGSLSPYVPADLIQLVAIGIVYLILEGLAAGPRGAARFAAWFGFLLLLGVGLFEASRIAALFKMLAGADVSSITLTGKAAPATKGETPIPPMATGAPTGSTQPKG